MADRGSSSGAQGTTGVDAPQLTLPGLLVIATVAPMFSVLAFVRTMIEQASVDRAGAIGV